MGKQQLTELIVHLGIVDEEVGLRIKVVFARICFVSAAVLFFGHMIWEARLMQLSPGQVDLTTGHIYFNDVHGDIAYLTSYEHYALLATFYGSIVFGMLGAFFQITRPES